MSIKVRHKVVIIGAGPAGCACAIALPTHEFEVIILDNSKEGKFQIGESIPPTMNLLMKQLGVYENFLKENHEPCYGSCSYWGSDIRGYNDTILNPYGHGWHLDREKFNRFFMSEAENRNVKIHRGATFLSSEKAENGFTINYRNANGKTENLEANFVVDASGSKGVYAASQSSQKVHGTALVCLGIRFKQSDDKEVSKLTHLESVKDGWWYAARIPNNQMLVTFYTLSEVVKTKKLHLFECWMNELKQATQTYKLVEGLEAFDSKIAGFTTYSFCLNRVVGDNWLAIGDAASTYDPITAHGITKSVTNAIEAVKAISKYVDGDAKALVTFERDVQYQYIEYKKSRAYFYGLEQHWPDSTFWSTLQNSHSRVTLHTS